MLRVLLIVASWPASGITVGVIAYLQERLSPQVSQVYLDEPVSLLSSLKAGVILGWIWVIWVIFLIGLTLYDAISHLFHPKELADG